MPRSNTEEKMPPTRSEPTEDERLRHTLDDVDRLTRLYTEPIRVQLNHLEKELIRVEERVDKRIDSHFRWLAVYTTLIVLVISTLVGIIIRLVWKESWNRYG